MMLFNIWFMWCMALFIYTQFYYLFFANIIFSPISLIVGLHTYNFKKNLNNLPVLEYLQVNVIAYNVAPHTIKHRILHFGLIC